MNCTNCGAVLAPGTTTCPNCGTALGVQQPVMTEQPVQQPVSTPVEPVVDQNVMAPSQPIQQPMMAAGMPQPSPIPVQQQPAPQPSVGGIVPGQHTSNSGSKKGIIAIILIVLALAVGVGGYFIYDSIQENKAEEKKKEEEKKEEKDKDKEEYDYKDYTDEIKKNVKVKDTKKLSDGSLLLLVENKSSRIASVDIEIEFYDAEGNILGTDTEYVTVAPNSERYAAVSKYSVKEGYDTFEMNLSYYDYTAIMNLKNVKESELTKNQTEDEILVQYKNDTEYPMNMEVVCLFYLNNEVVYATNDLSSTVEAGNNANLEIDFYGVSDITYDRYELHAYAQYDTYDD